MSDNYPNASQQPYQGAPDYSSQPPAYGQPSAYGQPPAYDSYGTPDYSQAAPYGAPGPVQPSGKKGLGMTALILGALALVIGLILSIWMGVLIAPFATDPALESNPDLIPQDVAVTIGFLFLAMGLPSVIGLVAIIISIVAIVKKNGRGLAIAGLIIAVIAPVVCLIAMSVSGALGAI